MYPIFQVQNHQDFDDCDHSDRARYLTEHALLVQSVDKVSVNHGGYFVPNHPCLDMSLVLLTVLLRYHPECQIEKTAWIKGYHGFVLIPSSTLSQDTPTSKNRKVRKWGRNGLLSFLKSGII